MGNDRANTMSASVVDICRNFQCGSCTYGARCKFVHGNFRPRPISTASGSTGKINSVITTATSKPKEHATRNWLDLPSDITINILQRINVIEIVWNVQKVCTNWRQICKDPCMWRVVYLDYELHEIWKNIVDKCQGRLADITIVGFCDDEVLQYVAERSSQLRRLEIGVSNSFIYHLTTALKKFPLLEELSLDILIREEAIQALRRDCPMVKTLKLSNQFGSIEDGLGLAIAENLPGLRHLELTGCCLCTDSGLRPILDRCHNLQVLDLKKCYPINITGVLQKRCLQQIKCVKFSRRFY